MIFYVSQKKVRRVCWEFKSELKESHFIHQVF